MRAMLYLPMLRGLLWLALAAMPLWSHAIEEPDYDVLRQIGEGIELRQ